MNTDFLCEKRLRELNPHFHSIFSNTAFIMNSILENYKTYFPTYTDHTVSHSLQVIDFCNRLIGEENIDKLNADEIFVLLMACYLHDSGMGVSKDDYLKFRDTIVSPSYIAEHEGESITETIRRFHQEFSARFVRKYADFFEIPPAYVEAVANVARGHRRVDLFDTVNYPVAYKLPSGSKICVPYLAALIRLADELDIAADRNIEFLYSDQQGIDFRRHRAIKRLRIEDTAFVLEVDTDDDDLFEKVIEAEGKLNDTLILCRAATNGRTPFTIKQETVKIERL